MSSSLPSLAAAIPLFARHGWRRATVRSIADAVDMAPATLIGHYKDKTGILAAAAEEAVGRDAARMALWVSECEAYDVSPALAGPYLSTVSEAAAGQFRSDSLMLLDLWLSARSDDRLERICFEWLQMRRDAFRSVGKRFGGPELAYDFLCLQSLSETAAALSCGHSSAYHIMAAAGFIETFAMLTGVGPQRATSAIHSLASSFYTDESPIDLGDRTSSEESSARMRLITAASSLIEREGFGSLSTRRVAEAAGVSPALIGYHFESTDALALAALSDVFERIQSRVETSGSREELRVAIDRRIASRQDPQGEDRARSRGSLELALASVRTGHQQQMGLAIRRQRGRITHATIRACGVDNVTRLMAASHALWSAAVFITAEASSRADKLFNVDEQCALASDRLLQL